MLIKELNLDVEFKLTDLLKKEQMDPEFVKVSYLFISTVKRTEKMKFSRKYFQ